jgi:pSer/pThr/pTyr-binding forkhead associated (FHA) protein
MDPTVTLLATRGPLAGRKFVFQEAMNCLIGRSRDCAIVLPLEREHLDVSRRHCLLEIVPPSVRIRDLGSLNGTSINGKKIGQRGASQLPAPVDGSLSRPVVLIDGDEIQLGEHTAFRVCVFDPKREKSPHNHRRSSGELRFEASAHT